MTKDSTDSPMPINKMILLDQLKRYNDNIRKWANNTFFTSNDAQDIIDQLKLYNDNIREWAINTFFTDSDARHMINQLFGVGYVWISYTNRSPASTVGGTWTPITGRFPYFNAGSSTGGTNSQTLSIAQMPAHKHRLDLQYGRDWTNEGWNWSASSSGMFVTDAESASVGGGQPYNNMPAYQTLYAWRRIA